MAVADVYDALISKRVYKPRYTHREACEMIAGERNLQFDPSVVAAFSEVKDRFLEISREFGPDEKTSEK
jgi:putative two-component system response regulator